MDSKSNINQKQPNLKDISSHESVTCSHILNHQPRVVIENISDAVDAVQREELNEPDNLHSPSSHLVADKKYLKSLPIKQPIKWPEMADDDAWNKFESSVSSKLLPLRPLQARVDLLESSIYEVGVELFGHPPVKNQSNRVFDSRRNRTIELVKSKNELATQLKDATCSDQIDGLQALLLQTKQSLRKLRKADNGRKKRWKRRKVRDLFKKNPYKAGKDLLKPRSSIKLVVDQFQLDHHLQTQYKDTMRECPLPPLIGLEDMSDIRHKFDGSWIKKASFEKLLMSRRNGSCPGPNYIPYKVYKKCHNLSDYLFDTLSLAKRRGKIPPNWRIAFTSFIPKVENPDPSKIPDFREISLLNVEGKLFFSLISERIYDHIVRKNKFVDSSVQKGCMESVPGCWEHISMVWEGLKQANTQNKNIAVIWLDIANAYGSIPHQLIFLALERYGVSKSWVDLVKNYYEGLWSRSHAECSPSNWHRHEKGIFAGCTISIILFLAGFNILLEYTQQVDFEGFVTAAQVALPLVRGFMDDLTLMATKVPETNTLLQRSSTALAWARMEWKVKKSRCMIIKDGSIVYETPFSVNCHSHAGTVTEVIPSIHGMPIKFLGRVVDQTLKDKDQVTNLVDKIHTSLEIINKSHHYGVNKVWILQFLLLPALRWLLMIYEVSITVASSLEKKIARYIRNWLGLHRTLSPIALYSKQSPCPLPISSLVGIEKTAKAGALLQLRDSSDISVSSNTPTLHAGRVWAPAEAVEDAESILYFRELLGSPAKGRMGLGYIPRPPFPAKGTKEHRKIVCDTLFEEHDKQVLEDTIQKYSETASKKDPLAIQKFNSLQLHWIYWCDYIRNDLSWKAIWAMGPDLMRFAIQATFNTMSCPKNKVRWKESSDPSCELCSYSPCTIPHILSACPFSLKSGRYTFRHDSVVKALVKVLNEEILKKKSEKVKVSKAIKFVKAGAKQSSKGKKDFTGILDDAKDWVLHCDLGGNTPTVPPSLAITSFRPDIFLYSVSLQHAITIENSSGCEENFPTMHEYKETKYASLDSSITSNGWQHSLFCIEVGARGYCANNVLRCLKKLGFANKKARDTAKELGLTAMKASFALWLARSDKDKVFEEISHPENVEKMNYLLKSSSSPKPSTDSSKTTLISTAANISSKIPKPVYSSKPVGLRNIGQTCYINAILQSLVCADDIWSHILPTDLSSSNFLKYLVSMLKLMRFKSDKVDPKFIVARLASFISKASGKTFVPNRANDAPEVLEYILADMLSCCSSIDNVFTTSYRIEMTCDICETSSCSEDTMSILRVPIRKTVNLSIQQFFRTSSLDGENQRFCAACGGNQDATSEVKLVKPPQVLIVQLQRFTQVGVGNFIKNSMKVSCDSDISLVEKIVEPHTRHSYRLISAIDHSGTYSNGHYTCFVLDKASNQWFWCNDSIVEKTSISLCLSPYLLFYRLERLEIL